MTMRKRYFGVLTASILASACAAPRVSATPHSASTSSSAVETPSSPAVNMHPRPPATPARDSVDHLFGETIVDPYRWMESPSAEFAAWLKAQADYARRTLDELPDRSRLVARLRQLNGSTAKVMDAKRRGRRLFYMKRAPEQELYSLCYRDGADGDEVVLVDPEHVPSRQPNAKYSIDYYEPSPNGRLVAFGISSNGSEDAVLHVADADARALLPDAIDRARWSFPSWEPDSKSFFYKREPDPKGLSESDRLAKARVYLHTLGSASERDPAIFGWNVLPDVAVPENAFVSVWSAPECRYLFAVVEDGVQHAITVYAAARKAGGAAALRWRRIVQPGDGVDEFDVHGDDLYVKIHRDSPRGTILRTSLSRPELPKATVVVAPSDAVLVRMASGQDALYVQTLEAGIGRVLRIPFGGGGASRIPLPFDGAIKQWSLSARGDQPGVLFQLESWTASPRLLEFDPKAERVIDTNVSPGSPADFSGVTATEVSVVGDDGTSIPLSIVRKATTNAIHDARTLLEVYGAYGVVSAPKFDPMLLAWLERGGVYAVCHARGGGEYGEGWHDAGRLEKKVNTVKDFIACGQYLVAAKLTSPSRLAAIGYSAGGIPVAGALTRRPDLFGAVVIRSGMVNALRFEELPIGPSNTPEFGTRRTADGMRGLSAIDAYQHVVAGVRYPAVLLTTGSTDSRVSPWQSAKLAARLQTATASEKPILLRVDYGVGHGTGTTKSDVESERADIYAFLWSQLGSER